MSHNVAVISLGCAKNLVDSQIMLKLIIDEGHKIVDDPSLADIVIVNTCGFIESAKQESINTIIEMGYHKRFDKCKVLIATGCLSERYNEELMNGLSELDAVIGTGDYKNIIEVINKTINEEKVIKYGNQEKIDIENMERFIDIKSSTAYIKIAEGCDNRCTYCVIPSIRGKYRSRKMEKIIEEANSLADKGIKEVIIIAQDTTRYGEDIYGKRMLPELLKSIALIEGIEWIRLLYTYPDRFDDDLITVLETEEKICKYLDIPIQHSSDKILRKMGRHTSKSEITSLINNLRRRIPGIVIRTSLIVGFPGETKDDFEDLLSFVKEIKFERLGVFTYSKEEGTAAYNMENHINYKEKVKRQSIIMETQMDISLENNKKLVKKELKVLLEGHGEDGYYGRSYRDAPEVDGIVYLDSNRPLELGEFYNVLIDEASEYDLYGECIDEYSK